MTNIFSGFIIGLIKSFNGKDYLRDLNKCKHCNNKAFFNTCLKCEMDELYRGANKK